MCHTTDDDAVTALTDIGQPFFLTDDDLRRRKISETEVVD